MSERGCPHGPLAAGETCSACEGLSKTESAIRDEIRRMVAKKENADRTRIEASFLAGVRAGLEAAAASAHERGSYNGIATPGVTSWQDVAHWLRSIDAEAIAKEAEK